MRKILVTGASGQVGSELQTLAANQSDCTFVFMSSSQLDITSLDAVNTVIAEGFKVVINCAAYTAVDKAESDKEKAHVVNATGAANLARACVQHNVRLIHISTDFVFDGSINRPLKEDDVTNPLSVYGATKLEGERLVNSIDANAVIVRTAWVYSSFGNNFLKTMLRLFGERSNLNVVFDQIGTPTYARDLAEALLTIATAENWTPGIYHYSNEGVASWYDFAVAIARLSGSSVQLNPIETSGYPTPAHRPAYSVLNKHKIKQTYGITIPHWYDSVQRCYDILKTN